jgi:hypothetical protein
MNPAGLYGRVVQCQDPDVSRTELIGATPTRLEFKPLIELRERESRLRHPGHSSYEDIDGVRARSDQF